jgi:ABC-2 type transport system ATP-binding protein
LNEEYVIQVSKLTKYYDKHLAVDNINFNVKKGEIFGFLGPNGAGKTTTIRMLTGLSKPSKGNASILGFNQHNEIVEVKKHIGVVPERSNLYDELSGLDNLIFIGQLYGVPRHLRRKRAEELLKMFGLYERKDSLFRTYSRGMKRSLTIAAALVHHPKILFLDEPTVGLDVVAARSLRNLINNLKSKGITIFLTTHYLEEADMLCDRVGIIVKGCIIKIDTPNQLKKAIADDSIIECIFTHELSEKQIKILTERFNKSRIISKDSQTIHISGGVPNEVYEELTLFTKEQNIQLESINSIKPSLEDAFIKITGLSPIVMAVEKGGKNQ